MQIIAQRYEAPTKGVTGLFSTWRKQLRPFIEDSKWDCYLVRIKGDGTPDAPSLIKSIDEVTERAGESVLYIRVLKGMIPMELTFASLTSSDDIPYDVTVSGEFRISDPAIFLLDFGFERILATGQISGAVVESMLATRGRPQVIDTVSTRTYEYVKDGANLPARWWSANLAGWAGIGWLQGGCNITQVVWASATEDRRREMEIQQRLNELQEEEARQAHERERRRLAMEREDQQAKQETENDRTISQAEREARLHEIAAREQLALENAAIEAETHRLEAVKKNAALEIEITQLRNGREEAERQSGVVDEMIGKMDEAVSSMTDVRDEMRTELAQCRAIVEAIQAGQMGLEADGQLRVAVSGTNLGSEFVARLEGRIGPATLAQAFREKQEADPGKVALRKSELSTRDIGGQASVNSLRVNQPLQFEIMAQRDGYATIINIGTSGKIWLHCPNAYVEIEQAVVRQGLIYSVPGDSLIPQAELAKNGLAYLEYGPTGWEELIAIVSDRPIIEQSTHFRATPNAPFVELHQTELMSLVERLSESPETWSVGVLSFLVEN